MRIDIVVISINNGKSQIYQFHFGLQEIKHIIQN